MQRKEIEFIINRDGEIKMDVKGMRGTACRDVVDAMKQIGDVLDERRKPEFFEQARSTLVMHQHSGSAKPL